MERSVGESCRRVKRSGRFPLRVSQRIALDRSDRTEPPFSPAAIHATSPQDPSRRARLTPKRAFASRGNLRGTSGLECRAMWFVQRVIPWLVLALVASPAHAADTVWEALQTAGSIVVLRHSFAPGGFDPPDARLDDCSTQRNLDDSGRRQARLIGEAFRQNGIAVGAVLSSPRCRCLDTARLAFGQGRAWGALQGALNDPERRERQLGEIRKAIAAHSGELPLVLVTHGSVITDLTGLSIRMGEFLVPRRAADGSHPVAGQLYVE